MRIESRIAASMIKRYSRIEVAEEMAHAHGCSYPHNSPEQHYWFRVRDRIRAAAIRKRKAK